MSSAVIYRVRSTPGGRDAYGDPIDSTTTRTLLDGAFTSPREEPEPTDRGRHGVIVGLTLYAPPDADLRYDDQVEVDGELYEIDGEPGDWTSGLTGWTPGVTAALTRARG